MSFSSLLLAADIDLKKVRFPVYASPKIDGFRSMVYQSSLRTRSNKPLANNYVRDKLSDPLFDRLDGELCCGEPTDPLVFKRSSSLLRKIKGEPDFTWWLFDDSTWDTMHFERRLDSVYSRVSDLNDAGYDFVKAVPHKIISNIDELREFEAEQIALGYEGIMVRDPQGIYKWGRSTVDEGILLKWKRVSIEEAVIVDCVELMHNENEAFINELGRTARRTLKDNLAPSGMIGAYVVKSPKYEREFRVSCGSMDHDQRRVAWNCREMSRGAVVKFKFFGYGNYEVPRQAIFEDYRPAFDMDAAWLEECRKRGIFVKE